MNDNDYRAAGWGLAFVTSTLLWVIIIKLAMLMI